MGDVTSASTSSYDDARCREGWEKAGCGLSTAVSHLAQQGVGYYLLSRVSGEASPSQDTPAACTTASASCSRSIGDL